MFVWLRIFVGGLPPLPEGTVLEKRRHFMDHHDALRRGLMQEPRGHADMYGAVLTHAVDDADLDVFFVNAEGYSSTCGHAVLAIAKVVVESGAVTPDAPSWRLRMNTPAGRVRSMSRAGSWPSERP